MQQILENGLLMLIHKPGVQAAAACSFGEPLHDAGNGSLGCCEAGEVLCVHIVWLCYLRNNMAAVGC